MIISKEDEAVWMNLFKTCMFVAEGLTLSRFVTQQQETLPPYSTHSEANNKPLDAADLTVQPVLVDATNLRTEKAWASSSKVLESSIQEHPKHLKPTTIVRDHRKKGSILGQYLIDISTSSGELDRLYVQPTVHLQTGDGNINAKIWLIGRVSNSLQSNCDRWPLIILDCVNGFINLEIVRLDCSLL